MVFNATINFKNDENIIFNSEKEFLSYIFKRYNKIFGLIDFARVAALIYGGIIYNNDDLCILYNAIQDDADIESIIFSGYKVNQQHSDSCFYTLSKNALKNFISMSGVAEDYIHANTTYYISTHAWEIKKHTILIQRS